MSPLYNKLVALLARVYYLPMRFARWPRVVAHCEGQQAAYYAAAEDCLASALEKQGLAPEVAGDSAFRFVSDVLAGLRRADEPVTP